MITLREMTLSGLGDDGACEFLGSLAKVVEVSVLRVATSLASAATEKVILGVAVMIRLLRRTRLVAVLDSEDLP